MKDMSKTITAVKPGANGSEVSVTSAAAEEVTGAEALLKSLIEEGVDTVFGYPGGAIMPVYDRLLDYSDSLRHILTRHEQGLPMLRRLTPWSPAKRGSASPLPVRVQQTW